MTYQEFLNTFIAPIQAFMSWCSTITTALLGNYVFITIVGLSVVTSLLYLFIDNFINLDNRLTKKRDLDNGGKK